MVSPSQLVAGGVHTIEQIDEALFFGDGTSFPIQEMIAIEAAGDFLILSRSGNKSPANCQMVNWSKGKSSLNARTTQSRQIHCHVSPSC